MIPLPGAFRILGQSSYYCSILCNEVGDEPPPAHRARARVVAVAVGRDSRIAYLGGTIGLLQTMHPAIGAGLVEHSNFFHDPVDRVFRSLPRILGAVYDDDADATAAGP